MLSSQCVMIPRDVILMSLTTKTNKSDTGYLPLNKNVYETLNFSMKNQLINKLFNAKLLLLIKIVHPFSF